MLAKADVLVEIEVKVFKASLGRGILLHGLSPNPVSIMQIRGKLSGLNFQLWIGGVWSSTLLVFQDTLSACLDCTEKESRRVSAFFVWVSCTIHGTCKYFFQQKQL